MSAITPAGAANAPALSFAPETSHSTANSSLAGPRNPAVQRCLAAFERTLQAELQKGQLGFLAKETASVAFRITMPDLIGPDNIRDFIACVCTGIAIEAISNADAPRFLYAAQVALAAAPRELRPAGRPRREPEPQSQQQDTPPAGAPAQASPC